MQVHTKLSCLYTNIAGILKNILNDFVHDFVLRFEKCEQVQFYPGFNSESLKGLRATYSLLYL